MEERKGRLRSGYTTGACAAAAAKAATWMLLTGEVCDTVSLLTPKGVKLTLEIRNVVRNEESVSCAVKKDSGDDPDVTNGELIFAEVSKSDVPRVRIDGGVGVGRVTKPGLDQPVGEAAINSVPRQMIYENVAEVCRKTGYGGGISVVISVPEGEKLAKKTFNPRLGIEGGISILGTTGIVEPMSEQALLDTIYLELRQRRALGERGILLIPGNYGADFIRQELGLDPARAVICSNYIGDAVDMCARMGFQSVLLTGHIGKLVKLAGGMFNTHSKHGDCRMEILTSLAAVNGISSDCAAAMMDCVTCDEALRILQMECGMEDTLRRLTERVEEQLVRRAGENMEIGVILFSRVYGLLGESGNVRQLLRRIEE